MAPYLFDFILLAVIFFFVAVSAKKGFVKASRTIIALILTAVLLTSMQPVVLQYLQSSPLGDTIKKTVSENITRSCEKEQLPQDTDTTDTQTSLMICDTLALPGFLSTGIKETVTQMSEIKNNVLEVITDSVTLALLRLIAVLLLFILVRIFVFLILKFMESLFGLPGLKTINHTLGALIGVFNSIIAVYIICGLVSFLAPMDKLPLIQQTVDATYVLKYFYNNNLLMSLFI